jgi:hypothetical protein
MGNAIAEPLAPLTDSFTGLTFPNFNDPFIQQNAMLSAADQKAGGQMFQTNLILPEPCEFLSPDLPACSIIRPTLSPDGGPMATVQSFIADGLFIGQNQQFLEQLKDLASEAEAARREGLD